MGPIVLQIGIKISLYCSCDAPTCHRSKPELAVFPPGKFTQMSLETMEPCFARCGVSSLVASNSLGWISSIYFFLINNWVCSICDRNDPAIFSLKNPIKCLRCYPQMRNLMSWTACTNLTFVAKVQDAYQILEELRDPTIYDGSSDDSWAAGI